MVKRLPPPPDVQHLPSGTTIRANPHAPLAYQSPRRRPTVGEFVADRHALGTGLRQALEPAARSAPQAPAGRATAAQLGALRPPLALPPGPSAAPAEHPDRTDRSRRRRRRGPVGEDAAPRAHVPPIALRHVDGNITRTGTEVMAWYQLAPQPWSFRGDNQREQLISQIAHQIGELTGRWLHLRVTTRPYPVPEWARAFDANSPAALRPADVPGALGWSEFLRGEQRHLMGQSMADKQVFLGVSIARRGMLDRWVDRAAPLLNRLLPSTTDAELTALDTELRHVDAVLSGPGLEAVPARAEDMAWLLQRSVGLGLPAPQQMPAVPTDEWNAEDLACFTDNTALVAEPYDPTLTVIGAVEGRRTERHLAVLTLGQMGEMRIPEIADPWMLQADRLPFPVEWSARIYVRDGEQVAGELQRQMGKVRSQERHYTHDHNLDPPLALARQADHVREVEDELSAGLTSLNTRLYGWWRIAVSGATEDEVTDRARALVDLYKPTIAVEHPEGQYRLAREFIPGEPLASTAYRRRGSATWAAAAVPAATAHIGDRHGIVLGETHTATRRPVTWDPWLAQEVRRSSGLTAITGGLGAGKSALTGMIVYKTLRAGARWTVLDPSGPLARLAELPEIAPYARHINLLSADPGILNPYRVVAEPRREHFTDEADPNRAWQRERKLAAATRRRLVLDVLSGLLPFDIVRLPQTRIELLRAVRAVGGDQHRHPGEVIDMLRQHAADGAEHASVVADFLDERRELPQAALLFPTHDDPIDPWADDADIRLTVLTMQGLSLPRPGSPREEWTDNEALGVELLNLASWLTQRTIYDADRNQRKGVALDETHFLSQVPTGKVLIDRLARDSRKFNVRALFASQLAGDLLRVSGFASLVNAVFVGRTDDPEAQADALRLLRVPLDPSYAAMLGTLSPRPRRDDGPDETPRQFVFADGAGGVEKIRINLSGDHLAHLRAALDTNPDGRRAVARALPPAAPAEHLAPRPLQIAADPGPVDDHARDQAVDELVDALGLDTDPSPPSRP